MSHTVAMSMIPYILARFPILPRGYSHLVAFISVLLYMLAMHTYRLIMKPNSWEMDITGRWILETEILQDVLLMFSFFRTACHHF